MAKLTLILLVCLLPAPRLLADQGQTPKQLQGTWRIVKAQRGDEEMPEDLRKQIKLQFQKDKLVLDRGGGQLEFELKFKSREKPHAFTVIAKNGPHKGQPGSGLYEFDKDGKLSMCFPNRPDDDGAEPIKSFDEGRKSGHLILELTKDDSDRN